MAWLKVSSVAVLGTRFTMVRPDRGWGGAYGMQRRPPRWACQMCGREGLGDETGPTGDWSQACRRGHAPCDWCGRMLTIKMDGQPRVHARCPERSPAPPPLHNDKV
ncbi:hypothetical protein SAMN04489747_0910 [Auraticoccus monumenti]|uniref:Uncharacterized protein n=1 Tax=Auraticoccus monumenti TaxID=675864 RepID=A0A1G6UML1_9ACTN|nr:hypothetical protein SAMN04489747_0910 [Auraticoccus monumenti]